MSGCPPSSACLCTLWTHNTTHRGCHTYVSPFVALLAHKASYEFFLCRVSASFGVLYCRHTTHTELSHDMLSWHTTTAVPGTRYDRRESEREQRVPTCSLQHASIHIYFVAEEVEATQLMFICFIFTHSLSHVFQLGFSRLEMYTLFIPGTW